MSSVSTERVKARSYSPDNLRAPLRESDIGDEIGVRYGRVGGHIAIVADSTYLRGRSLPDGKCLTKKRPQPVMRDYDGSVGEVKIDQQ